MPTLRAVGAFVVFVALAGLSTPSARASAAAPPDSTEAARSDDPLAWARRVVSVRRTVAAAEAELDPDRQSALAAAAFHAVQDLSSDPAAEASVRDLALRAQAAYEAHHGAVALGPLAPSEWAALRGPSLAALGTHFAPPLRDPAVVAAERAEAARLARAAEAEAARAAGPAHLFYPAEAAPLVDRQRAVARRLAATGRRGRSLLGRIERTLRRRGLPADLQYVALIESALNPQAESHAGAEGLWQFMPATAAEFGLDSLTVHEAGPSTEAAARYLRWLGRRFGGDWPLALAAYNCGVGRVEASVRAYREETGADPTFWDLQATLPAETRDYVPRFIAVAEAMGARG